MGSIVSKTALLAFEILNEIYIGIASGVLGTAVLAHHGIKNNRLMETPSVDKVIVITGCDSGLGYSIALHSAEMGFSVLAGCYDMNSEGTRYLNDFKGPGKMTTFNLDITNTKSVQSALKLTTKYLNDNNSELWAVINNAAVMIFGEFEWLTEELIEKHVSVNLTGTLRFTNTFCPLLRLYKARLINISSHCAKTTLPGISVYGATKTAIKAFTSAFLIEMSKYGVQVIEFIPGSFMMQSNIIAKQSDYFYAMQSAFTEEQKSFYDKYFRKYNSFISTISIPTRCTKIDNNELYDKFNQAILSTKARRLYTIEPIRYSFYHMLFKASPGRLRDYFITKFMQTPEFESNKE